jgi:DNA polymerase-1
MYFRAYIVDPSLSTNGQPIGGLKGFLKILQKLTREINPDKIIICWDGPGGSQKRKTLVKDYKAGRKPIRLNRGIRNMSENEEIENKVWQQTRLIDYLNSIPVIQLMLESVEADDIISYVVQHADHKGWQKIIVSSDKDFYQLCDNETVVFRPIQKEFMNKPRLIEKFGIHPTNFALARAIAGDKSDNLPGVDGVGLPTVSKRFPFLAEDEDCTIDKVYDYCEEVDSKVKAYENIIEQIDKVKSNYDMMQLYSPLISIQGKNKIEYALKNFAYHFNKTEVRKMMIQDGFREWNWNDLFQKLNKISLVKGKE